MSEDEKAAMDGLPAEQSSEESGEAVRNTPVLGEGVVAVPEGTAKADVGEAAADEAGAAALADVGEAAAEQAGEAADTDADATAAKQQDGSAAGIHAEEQQGDSSVRAAEPASASPTEAEATAEEAAGAAAEEGAQEQHEPTEAEVEHAPAAVATNPAGSTEGAAEPQPEATKQPQPAEQQPRQSTHSQASRPASSIHAAASPEPKSTATAEAAAAAPAKQHAAEEEQAEPAEHMVSSNPHKETAVERLTTPTAMRMLKTLQQTQGDKTDWHTASGVVYKSKKLAPDKMAAMVDRLCVAKHKDDDMPPKLHAVKLVYDDNGREAYEPVKEVTKQENISYMAELYSRCQETRAKTQQQLAEKYLQPLVVPKAKSPAKADKAPAAEKA